MSFECKLFFFKKKYKNKKNQKAHCTGDGSGGAFAAQRGRLNPEFKTRRQRQFHHDALGFATAAVAVVCRVTRSVN